MCVCVCVISVWVCGASLLAPKPHALLFLYSTIIPNPTWCSDNEGHGFFHSRKNSSRCLITLFAFSGQNQAHNLTNMNHLNVLWNMHLYCARMCSQAHRKMRPDDLLMHHEYRPSSSYHAVPADRRNKTLECWLATLNASSAIMSHALEQINSARIGVICKSYARVLQVLLTSCLKG